MQANSYCIVRTVIVAVMMILVTLPATALGANVAQPAGSTLVNKLDLMHPEADDALTNGRRMLGGSHNTNV